jgi:hypothetical protein
MERQNPGGRPMYQRYETVTDARTTREDYSVQWYVEPRQDQYYIPYGYAPPPERNTQWDWFSVLGFVFPFVILMLPAGISRMPSRVLCKSVEEEEMETRFGYPIHMNEKETVSLIQADHCTSWCRSARDTSSLGSG